MPITVGSLQFGEADAKNEVFQQARYGSEVFRNSFQVPPKVDLNDLLRGARFFVSGQKGCGKTALLLHTQRVLADMGARTLIVLFKSGISETERARLAVGSGIEVVQTQEGYKAEYDYTTNWLWFIYRNLLRLIEIDDVDRQREVAEDLKRLVGVHQEIRTSTFSDLAIAKVKGAAKAGLEAGPFRGEMSAEIEAIKRERTDRTAVEVIEIIEKYLPKVQLKAARRCLLFFDELELFWNRPDQRERDLFLIRDLLQSVARVNRTLGAHSASFVVYASVRSEVLEEVNRVGPEIVRDITDFGVSVSWNSKGNAQNQPILRIVEGKIHASEVEQDELPTADVWSTYFPRRIYNKDIRDYLLDVSMFRPRNIVSRLNLAKNYEPNSSRFSTEAFRETSIDFSQTVWREIEEELLGRYSAKHVSNLKALLTAFKPRFKIGELEHRVTQLEKIDPSLSEGFRTRKDVVEVCRVLYRVGALGNLFDVENEEGQKLKRDRWSFRDMGEPTMDAHFIVHESLRKVFQLPFS